MQIKKTNCCVCEENLVYCFLTFTKTQQKQNMRQNYYDTSTSVTGSKEAKARENYTRKFTQNCIKTCRITLLWEDSWTKRKNDNWWEAEWYNKSTIKHESKPLGLQSLIRKIIFMSFFWKLKLKISNWDYPSSYLIIKDGKTPNCEWLEVC